MNIILLGAPGAGKGTQASQICEKYNLKHISTGDIFRENIKENTPLGILAKSYIDNGNLVPDEVTIEIVKERVSCDDCKNGVLLDGFPRTVAQAEALKKFLQVDVVIDISVPLEKLMRRITGRRVCEACKESFHVKNLGDNQTVCPACGGKLIHREDDNEETVASRLSVYTKQTAPLINFYKRAGILKTVNGNQTPQDVFNEIVEALKK